MKTTLNRLTFILAFFTAVVFTACEKDISEEKVGIETISIPQAYSAAVSNNNYAVPSTLNFGDAKNFKDDDANNKVNVFLGVSKSGKEDTEAFSVDIISKPDSISQMIARGETFVLLPSAAYAVPAKISLPAGQATANFNLEINKATLKTYAGKKVAVCLGLANPTKYKLNEKASKIVIIIDVNALKLN